MIRVFLLTRKIKFETFLVNFFCMDSSIDIVLFIMEFTKLGFEGLTRMQICFVMARKIRCARSNARLLGLFSEPGSNPFTGHSRILGLIFNISHIAVNCDLLLELYVVENNSQLIGSISFSSSSLSLVRFLPLKLDDRFFSTVCYFTVAGRYHPVGILSLEPSSFSDPVHMISLVITLFWRGTISANSTIFTTTLFYIVYVRYMPP